MKKKLGQFFTPSWIVKKMLDEINYNNKTILYKNIIEPSFGDGAFLSEIVERYIKIALNDGWDLLRIKEGLETHIFGIELDKVLYDKCINRLNNITSKFNIKDVKWSFLNENSLIIDSFDNQMDYVIGNPPYIRVHTIAEDTRKIMKENYSLSQHGLSDIYISFYELGIKMLKSTGKLIFITPNSFMYNTSASDFRQYITKEKNLRKLINFNTYQVFDDASTYATIMLLDLNYNNSLFDYYLYDGKNITFVDNINLNDFKNKNWSFSTRENLNFIETQMNRGIKLSERYNIQYGFATLRDKIYISDDVHKVNDNYSLFNGAKIENDLLYPIVKGSKYNGEEITTYIIYPYQQKADKWSVILEDDFKEQYPYGFQYLLLHKDELLKRSMDKGYKAWYQFGRSQGLQTMFNEKLVISTFLDGEAERVSVYKLPKNTFVYSGIFITGDNLELLYDVLKSKDFCRYIKVVGKDLRNNYKNLNTKMIKNYSI